MAKKRKQAVSKASKPVKTVTIVKPITKAKETAKSTADAAKAQAAAIWHSPAEYPPDTMKIEMYSSGDILVGHHSGGMWKPDGQSQSVTVTAWRPYFKR